MAPRRRGATGGPPRFRLPQGLSPGHYVMRPYDTLPRIDRDGRGDDILVTVEPAPPPPPRPLNLAPLDRGVRLVRHLNTRYDEDPELPFKVEIVLRGPEFMSVAFAFIYGGTEDIVAQGVDLTSLRDFVVRNELATHLRFRRLTLTGPDGFRAEFTSADIARRRGW